MPRRGAAAKKGRTVAIADDGFRQESYNLLMETCKKQAAYLAQIAELLPKTCALVDKLNQLITVDGKDIEAARKDPALLALHAEYTASYNKFVTLVATAQ